MDVDVYVQRIVHWVVKRVAKGVLEHVKVHVANKLSWAVMVVTQLVLNHAILIVIINASAHVGESVPRIVKDGAGLFVRMGTLHNIL